MTRKDIFAALDRLVSWLSVQIGYSVAAFLIALAVSLALNIEGQTVRFCLGVCP